MTGKRLFKCLKRSLCMMVVTFIVLVSLFSKSFVKNVNAKNTNVSNILKGKTISVIGDSVSTYVGYSDKEPITDESCTHRYGEAYYGPVGSDCNDTSLSVDDIWCYQSAKQLGAEILMNNSGNSTGLLYATYPNDADWQLYLEEMLAYKSRADYLGKNGRDPDIIAIYIGSNDVARFRSSKFGNIESINFNSLIKEGGAGSYIYSEPTTVAEAYCILMHKISIKYPNAEVYCFTVLPNSGGDANPTGTTRINSVIPFNRMIESVANYYHAKLVDLYSAFNIDSNKDGVLSDEEWNHFKEYFGEGPHYNAEGFDLVSKTFNNIVLHQSKYVVTVESRAGLYENVETNSTYTRNDNYDYIERVAQNYITDNNMTVDFNSYDTIYDNGNSLYNDRYSSKNQIDTYHADGGYSRIISHSAPIKEVGISLNMDNPNLIPPGEILVNENKNVVISGDVKQSEDDGIYDYTITTTAEGSVLTETQSVTISKVEGSEYQDDMTYICSSTTGSATTDNGLMVKGKNVPIVDIPTVEDIVIKDGYSYYLVGHQNFSKYWAARLFTSAATDGDYVNEEPVYSDDDITLYTRNNHDVFRNRKFQVPKLYLPGNKIVECPDAEKPFPALYEIIEQFSVMDKNGNVMTCYCADETTEATEGFSYNMVNLEDATYYTNEEAHMIRSICSHAYWGTESGFGSLSQMKQYLRESGDFTEEELARINDGMAMTASQYAIWTFSNKMDDIVFVNTYYATKVGVYNGVNTPDEDVALIFKVYNYLVNLQPTEFAPTETDTSNTIINENNFLNSVLIKITDKPDRDENKDADITNDIYIADFAFDFKVAPSSDNGDNLVLKIIDEEGHTIATGRIAGTAQEGETVLTVDDNGFYIMKGIELQEGIENISFQLSGTQNISYDAYLLQSEIKSDLPLEDSKSQPLVAIAKGRRAVNIRMDISFQLDVEDDELTEEHIYRNETTTTAKTEITVIKQWEGDYDNKYNTRPSNIKVELYANGTKIDTAIITESDNWQYTFEDLDVYDENENEIVYVIDEEPVKGYSKNIDGFVITNTIDEVPGTGVREMPQIWILTMILSFVSIIYINKRR